ncbi:hypothetical protein ABIC45_002353 [Mucilaginibacter rubeus]|uniref:hypothetical protein n=1 Tax=unclassified Mucilaginibacter TaxID=2617802 RepID=UPI001587A733|nr:hypothetical protein [Mucilaginibacter sp. NFR10]
MIQPFLGMSTTDSLYELSKPPKSSAGSCEQRSNQRKGSFSDWAVRLRKHSAF